MLVRLLAATGIICRAQSVGTEDLFFFVCPLSYLVFVGMSPWKREIHFHLGQFTFLLLSALLIL